MIEYGTYFRCEDATYMPLATCKYDRARYIFHIQRYYLAIT